MSAARHARHASTACIACRKWKKRCDGVRPVCGLCKAHDRSCELGDDRRKYPTHAGTKQLEDKIARLEHKIRQLQSRSLDWRIRKGASERDDDTASDLTDDDDSTGIERLKIINDSTGEIIHFGPPSCLMHLPESAFAPSSNAVLPNGYEEAPSLTVWNVDGRFRPRNEPHRFSWNMHLPASCAPLDRKTHDSLLDSYEQVLRGSIAFGGLLRVDRFQADLHECTTDTGLHPLDLHKRTDDYSPLLHNALLAVTAMRARQLRQGSSAISEEQINALTSHAINLIVCESERPLLSTVRGVILISIIMGYTSRLNSAFSYFGMAIRIADTIGIKVDCSHLVETGRMSLEKQQDRDAVLWILFIQDKLQCVTLGRSPGLPMSSLKRKLPPYPPIRIDPNGKDSRFLVRVGNSIVPAMCRLSLLAEDILEQCYSPGFNRGSRRARTIQRELNQRLDEFLNDLPPQLCLPSPLYGGTPPSRVIALHIAHWFNVILLNRPFYRPSPMSVETPDDSAVSDHAADMIVDLLSLHEQADGLTWSLLSTAHAVFHAGSIYLMKAAAANADDEGRAPADTLLRLERCIHALEKMQMPMLASWNATTLKLLRSQWLINPPMEPIPDMWEDFEAYLQNIDV